MADLDRLVLGDADHHHLARVLRLRPGERVTAADGAGRWRVCAVPSGWPSAGALEPVEGIELVAEPAPRLTVAFALTKGERPEWVVQKLTEVGIDRIVPVVAERSIVRWDDERAGRHIARLRAVAREAAVQSRQAWLPEVDEPVAYATLLAQPGGPAAVAVADLDATDGPSLAVPFVLVGPEGGWSEPERAAAVRRVSLGPSVLRAETAAVAAGVLLAGLRSSLVREAGDPGSS